MSQQSDPGTAPDGDAGNHPAAPPETETRLRQARDTVERMRLQVIIRRIREFRNSEKEQ